MSTPCRQAKRGRTLETYFKSQQPNEIEETTTSNAANAPFASSSNATNHEVPIVDIEHEEFGGQRTEFEATSSRSVPEVVDNAYITSLERDPGLRIPIMHHPFNKRDEVRRAYLQMGRNITRLAKYPKTPFGIQRRGFSAKYFDEFHWIEYSKSKDAAYCFYCFLFETDPPTRPEYTCEGFRNWHNVKNGSKCVFLAHMGKGNSFHFDCVKNGENLSNTSQHISTIFNVQSKEEIRRNRLRLTTTIEVCRWLAFQQCAFRGHDESQNSKNRGNFIEMVRYSASLNENVKEVVLDNAPGNAKYTSPVIQKEILNIISNKVRNKIREEIGDKKYCILVDESKDASDKEQMVLVLRYVDSNGYVQERFYDIQRVKDTCALTLKKGITDILNHYNLPIENMRGQGYDGASNMSGKLNGLQSLFLKECKYAYYVHCFAHRLQLALLKTAENLGPIWKFFSMLNSVVNLVTGSAQRISDFQSAQQDDINQRLAAGELETGKGLNQIGTLPRATDTRWSSHYNSECSLIDKFDATCVMIEDISNSDPNVTCGVGEAQSILEEIRDFKFVFVLHLIYKIMGITEILCQGLQKKTQDIVNAVALVSTTKDLLRELREDGWEHFIESVCLFCAFHNIEIPDMEARFMVGTGRSCQQRDTITVDHRYHCDIFNATIDYQLAELDRRFPEDTMELLILSSCLDPRESFKSFDVDKLCRLASKFYPEDFCSQELHTLRNELHHYRHDVVKHSGFKKLSTISELCIRLVETNKAEVYPLIDRLIRLILTLPVSTATAERYFSTMTCVKSALRNKMEQEFLKDCMMLYIESILARNITIDSIIDEFISLKDRKVQLKLK